MLGAKVHSGAEAIADAIDLDEALVDADWAITGEGRSDGQTLRGKAPYVLCQRARKLTVPASLLSGAIDAKSLPALNQHFAGCFSIVPGPIALTESLAQCSRADGSSLGCRVMRKRRIARSREWNGSASNA
jgi:glycerate kinase